MELPHLERAAILCGIQGVGPWTTDMIDIFHFHDPDIWPAGDLAVQVEIGRLLGLADRPAEKHLREIAERWRPYRGAAAILAWHSYNSSVI